MSEEQQAQGSQEEQQGQAQEAAEGQQTQEETTAGQQQTEQAKEPQSVEELPKWARDEIKNLRKENGNRRAAQRQQEEAESTELQNVTQERDTLKKRTRS